MTTTTRRPARYRKRTLGPKVPIKRAKTIKRYMLTNDYFFNIHASRLPIYKKFNKWNTLHFKTLLAPYTWALAWDFGDESLSNFINLKHLNTDVPYIIYILQRRSMRGLIQGFLTQDDMQFGRKQINKEEALIAYTVEETLNN